MKKTYPLATCFILMVLILLSSCSNDDNAEAKGLLSVDLSISNHTVTAPEITGATTSITLSKGEEKKTFSSLMIENQALTEGTWHVEARVSNDTATYYAYDGDVLIASGKNAYVDEAILPMQGGTGNLDLTLTNNPSQPLTGYSFIFFNCLDPKGTAATVKIEDGGKIVASDLPTGTYCFICINSTPIIGFFSILSGMTTKADLAITSDYTNFKVFNSLELMTGTGITGKTIRAYGQENEYQSSMDGIWLMDSKVIGSGNVLTIADDYDKGYTNLQIISYSNDLCKVGFANMKILTKGETTSFLNVPGSMLALYGGEDQYSTNGGVDWNECNERQFHVDFADGDHVMVRKGDDGIVSDLGTIEDKNGKIDIVLRHPAITTYLGSKATTNTPTAGQKLILFLPFTTLGSSYTIPFTYDVYMHQGDTYTEDDKILDDGKIFTTDLDKSEITVAIDTNFVPAGEYQFTIVGDKEKNTGFCSSGRSTSTSVEIHSESSDGAFIVYNSWGSEWLESNSGDKDGGYYYLPFNRLKEMNTYAFPLISAKSLKPANSLVASFKIDGISKLIQNAPLSFIVRDGNEEVCRKGFLMGGQYALAFLPYFPYPQYTLTYDLSELTKNIESGYTITLEKATESAEAVTISDFSITLKGKLTKEYTAKPETPDTITFDDISDRKKDESKGVLLMDEKTRPITEEEAERLFYSMPETPTVIDGHGTGLVRPESIKDLMGLKIMETGNSGKAIDAMYLDKKLDLREKNYMPPIGDQKNVGSCVAFSLGYYDMTAILAKQNGWNLSGSTWDGIYEETDLNLEHIMSPAFPYHLSNGGTAGLAYVFVQNLLGNTGISSWKTMGTADVYDRDTASGELKAYTCPSEEAFKEAINNRIWNKQNYENDDYSTNIIYLNTDQSIMNVINILETSALPVTFAINANNFQNGMNKARIIIGEVDNSQTNHAQTIVGYVTGSEWEKIKNPTP